MEICTCPVPAWLWKRGASLQLQPALRSKPEASAKVCTDVAYVLLSGPGLASSCRAVHACVRGTEQVRDLCCTV